MKDDDVVDDIFGQFSSRGRRVFLLRPSPRSLFGHSGLSERERQKWSKRTHEECAPRPASHPSDQFSSLKRTTYSDTERRKWGISYQRNLDIIGPHSLRCKYVTKPLFSYSSSRIETRTTTIGPLLFSPPNAPSLSPSRAICSKRVVFAQKKCKRRRVYIHGGMPHVGGQDEKYPPPFHVGVRV